jgi:hypothetical protein
LGDLIQPAIGINVSSLHAGEATKRLSMTTNNMECYWKGTVLIAFPEFDAGQ